MARDPAAGLDEPLPPEVEARVLAEVEPGETIAWVGRPRGRTAAPPMLTAFAAMGGFTVAFALLWLAAALSTRDVAAGALVGLPLLGLGAAMAAAPYRLRRMAEQTAYVVTDRRAILFLPGALIGRKVVSYRPGAIRAIQVIERPDGSGDLVLGTVDDARLLWLASLGVLYDRGFERVAQVREVESLIRRTLLDRGDAPA